jgi:hypothetical protein
MSSLLLFIMNRWVVHQNKLEIPRDKDEVNEQEIHEYDGREYNPDTMVSPLTPIRHGNPNPSPGLVRVDYDSRNESYRQDLHMSVDVMKD